MKKSKVMLASALILGASVLSGANTFARPSNGNEYTVFQGIPGLFIRNDREPVEYQQVSRDNDGVNLVVKYEAESENYETNQENNNDSNGIKNPNTIDSVVVVLGFVAICLVVLATVLVANSQKRYSGKTQYSAVFFGTLILASSLTVIASKAIHATDVGGVSPEGFVHIGNEELYNALKECFAEQWCRTTTESTEIIEFDDATQSVSHPEIADMLVLDSEFTGIKLSDINDLFVFSNIEYLYLGNNNLTDFSIFTQQNFPNLSYLDLRNNHIESFASIAKNFERDPVHSICKLSQSLTYKYDENGKASLPPLLKEVIDVESGNYRSSIYLSVYNLKIDDNFESVQILDANKEAYIVARISYYDGPN